MKKLKISILLFVICICTFINTKAIDYNVYCNERYNYNIYYPKQWTNIVKSDNGDGAILYNADGNEIRVYANYCIDKDKYNNGNLSSTLPLEKFAFTNKDQGEKILHYTLISNNVEYNLYAKTSSNFYDKEKESILNIIKNMDISK